MQVLEPPLRPKRGRTLRVLKITRVSRIDPERRESLSNQAQDDLLNRWLDAHYQGSLECLVLDDVGSGERLDRAQLLKAQDLVASGGYDLVLAEDLGRIMRRSAALNFCEECEDTGTRLIAINDSIDTAQEDWRLNAFFAAMRHELYNKDTSRRIKRQQRSNFERGGMIQFFLPGYIKPQGAKHDSEVSVDPEATKVYDEWFDKLERGWSYGRIADWLNDINFPVGPCCTKSTRWSAWLVANVTKNPLLKGMRRRNMQQSKRVNATGRSKSVKAPPELLLTRECPHLAHISPDRFDRVNALLEQRNKNYLRANSAQGKSRSGVPRKRTTWPGQHLTCGICGRLLLYAGSKGKRQLTCGGAIGYKCWSSVSLNSAAAGEKIVDAIVKEIETWPAYHQELANAVEEELAKDKGKLAEEHGQLVARRDQLAQEAKNIGYSLRQLEDSTALLEQLSEIEQEQREIRQELATLGSVQDLKPELPDLQCLKEMAGKALREFDPNAPDFACWIRCLVPVFHVFPVRLIDGGKIHLRAHFEIDLRVAQPGYSLGHAEIGMLKKAVIVDLFDLPQRARLMDQVWKLSQQQDGKLTERDIAHRLSVTQPVVQRAKRLYRQMVDQGRNDPYEYLTSHPLDTGKLRRHLHKRYRFEPLVGYPLEAPEP